MENKPKIPITRLNKWYDDMDFDLDIEMGREAIEEDNNFTIVLFRVDRNMTLFDDLYGEANEDGVRFQTPVELKVVPLIEEAKNTAMNPNGGQRHLEDGNLSFGIYQKQLDELGVEISYGDYIGYAISETIIRYYSVANDGLKNYDSKHTIMGYKSAFRSILCVPTNKDEFKGY
jgi:hypothetical protein